MIDMHTHSTCSDGEYSPEDLAALAQENGITLLALCDHDTTAGLTACQAACTELGIGFVPGIEMEIDYTRGEFHLLGLGLQRPGILESGILETARSRRIERNTRILEKIRKSGLVIPPGLLEEVCGSGIIGRPHIAELLVRIGAAPDVKRAFKSLLRQGKRFYVHKAGLPLEETIDAIHAAGGMAVLAHPPTLNLKLRKLAVYLDHLKSAGLDGIEAYHPMIKPDEGSRLAEIARSLGLFVTAGSDFHGSKVPGRRIGKSSQGIEMSRELAGPFAPKV